MLVVAVVVLLIPHGVLVLVLTKQVVMVVLVVEDTVVSIHLVQNPNIGQELMLLLTLVAAVVQQDHIQFLEVLVVLVSSLSLIPLDKYQKD